jgi:AcrR family transcriptional regulator
MPFSKDETEETKNRIIDIARRQISDRGFDATRVDDIARDAGVNKALIYYYFKSKEAILDHLIQTLFDDIKSISMDFIRQHIVSMIRDGRLDILPDRWHFTTQDDVREFDEAMARYVEGIVDFMLTRRQVVRILLFESLKNGKHHNDVMKMIDMLGSRDDDSIYRTIHDADRDFDYTADAVLYKFFFDFLPILNFAAYYDDYLPTCGMSAQQLRESFLRGCRKKSIFHFEGSDIVF